MPKDAIEQAMSRITLYIVSELLKVFSATLLVMTVFVLLGLVAVEALREGLSLAAVVRLLPYAVPMALRFTVPGTMLFAVCLVYGRMAADNEVIAVKSLGIAPWILMRPAIALSVVLSALTVWLNDVAVSWGTAGINRVVLQSVEQIIYGRLRTQRSYSNDRGLSIIVQDVQDRRLLYVTLTYQPADGSHPISILAQEAELKLTDDASSLVIIFQDMQIESEQLRGTVPGEFQYEIPLSFATRKDRHGVSPSDIPMRELRHEVQRTLQQIDYHRQRWSARAALYLASGQLDRLVGDQWQRQMHERDMLQGRLYRLLTEPWRRWAAGFSCFCFVAVGVPLAMLLRTSDIWTTFGLCFLPILVVYYPLFMAGVDRAKAGAAPPAVVWGGNLLLLGVGWWLMRKADR